MQTGQPQRHSTEGWVTTFHRREKEAGGIVPYFVSTVSNMWPFLEQVKSLLYPGARVLEVGCGPCLISTWFSHLIEENLRCCALEYDRGVLDYAQRNIIFFRAPVTLVHGDMFRLPFLSDSFDIVIHDGVLEHFSDDEIRDTIREQSRVAKNIVFSVPVARAKGFPGLYGDERLLDISRWKGILEETGAVTVKKIAGTTPPRGVLSRTLWRLAGVLGLPRFRSVIASAVTFTLSRRK